MTIYAGDHDNKCLIVIPQKTYKPKFINLDWSPKRAALMKQETILVIVSEFNTFFVFDLQIPINPILLRKFDYVGEDISAL